VPLARLRRGREAADLLKRRLQHPQAPLWLLGGVSLLSLGARLAYLDKPLDTTTHSSALIFDEQFYVNAARVILGIHPGAGNNYMQAALSHDPNAEHPPLVKLLIAGTMWVFGDNPWGWRIASVLFGSLAILAMYWLVRSALGGSWLALGAATLMAADNLMLVHGRIATLDIFVVTFMIVAVALYLRGHPLVAGGVLGIGLCTKLVALDAAIVILLLELSRVLFRDRHEITKRTDIARERALEFVQFLVASAIIYFALLFALDLVVAPIGGPGDCPTDPAGFHNPVLHTAFMLCYAGKLTSPGGPTGIASYPWQWLLNLEPINYYSITRTVLSEGKVIATPSVVTFVGQMNPAIIFIALPSLGLAVHMWWAQRDTISLLCLAWFLGTFVPFIVAAAPLGSFGNRTSYLYYMVVVLPAVFIALAQFFSPRRLPRTAIWGYVAIVGYWFVTLYPIRTWTGT
jgi:dolichyl-phosphate-mannose-protein mannosyltransferase